MVEEEIAEPEEKTEVEKVQDNLSKLKAANDETEKELLRQEELRAKIQIGGKAETPEEPKTKEELDEEEAQKFLREDDRDEN